VRILHVSPTYLPSIRYGGPIYSVHGLCVGLSNRSHEVHVYTTNVDGETVSSVPVGCPVEKDGVKITYFSAGFGRRLYRSPDMTTALRRSLPQFDIVHLHSVFLWPTTAVAAAARRIDLPYVLSPRGMLVPELIQRKSSIIKRSWIDLFERRNLARAAAVHVTSDLEAASLKRLGLCARRIAVIPNGVEPPPSRPDGDSANLFDQFPKPMVLYLGRINWKKGLDRLLTAMALVPGAHLVVAGNDEEDYTKHLRSLACQSGVSERIHFVGPIYGEQKWKAFAAAKVFALPSYSENFGNAVLEAMAASVPVVVTREVGLAKAIAELGAGLVVDGSTDKIAEAISRILADTGLRTKMGAAGRRSALEHFSWASIAAKTEQLYIEVTSPNRNAASSSF
jgi:glycosyltransferase involved in cell wall biosynthesis